MIKPHGSEQLMPLYVADDNERAALAAEAQNLTAITVSSAAAANAVMLAAGYFTPLTGYMNLMDSLSVAQKLPVTFCRPRDMSFAIVQRALLNTTRGGSMCGIDAAGTRMHSRHVAGPAFLSTEWVLW